MGGGGGAPEPTAEQKAMERRQREQLDKETASSERRLKAIAQKKIGKASLLGTPIEQAEAPDGPTITEGFALRQGQVKKIPKFWGAGSIMAARSTKQGMRSASLLGKGTEKAAKGVKK